MKTGLLVFCDELDSLAIPPGAYKAYVWLFLGDHTVSLDTYDAGLFAALGGEIPRVHGDSIRIKIPTDTTALALERLFRDQCFQRLCNNIAAGYDVERGPTGKKEHSFTVLALEAVESLSFFVEEYVANYGTLCHAFRIYSGSENVCRVRPLVGTLRDSRFLSETDTGCRLSINLADIRFTEQEALAEAQLRVNKLICDLVNRLADIGKQLPPRILTTEENVGIGL